MRHHHALSLWLLAFLPFQLNSYAQEGHAVREPSVSSQSIPSSPDSSYAYDESKVVFHSSSILVQVPVVVTDKSGHHIQKISKDQFTVFEGGKEQKIAAFEEIAANDSNPLPPSPPGVFRNAGIEFHQTQAVTVIAIDSVNTPFLDQLTARQALVKYLADNLKPGPLLAVVVMSSKGMRVIQGLTSSPEPLIDALNRASGQLAVTEGISPSVQTAIAGPSDALITPNGFRSLYDFVSRGDILAAQFQQERAIEMTMRSFLQVAWSLTGVPGRKSLIWATSGFPFYLGSPGMVPRTGRLATLYEHALEALNDAHIAVYPVDVRGLVSTAPGADLRGGKGGAAYARYLQNREWLLQSTLDTLQEFSQMTGGRAFYNSNDLAEGFRRAVEDSSAYYLLGYYLNTSNDKPGWRSLKVKLQQKDTVVRAPSGFLVTNGAMNPQTTKEADLEFALDSPFEASGIPIWMQWKPVSGDATSATGEEKAGDTKKVAFELHFPGDIIGTQGDQNAIELDIFAIVETLGTKVTVGKPIQHTMKANFPPELLAKVRVQGLKYSSDLPLASGKYAVRFVVRDNVSGRVGSITAPLKVD